MAVAEFMLGPLCGNPRRVGKPLERELLGCLSARVREYRIVYRIIDEEHVVHVVRIEHRSSVYRAM
jgi:mRNA interferase RelE/StbE